VSVRKFKFQLDLVPTQVHRKHRNAAVLKIRVPTKRGKQDLILKDGDVVFTEDDPIAEFALTHYRPPKIPIKHHPKGVKTHMYHAYEEHCAKRPFVEIFDDSTSDHEL
jgi:hypothetical protein